MQDTVSAQLWDSKLWARHYAEAEHTLQQSAGSRKSVMCSTSNDLQRPATSKHDDTACLAEWKAATTSSPVEATPVLVYANPCIVLNSLELKQLQPAVTCCSATTGDQKMKGIPRQGNLA
jgi:hypothetical protein